MPAVEPSSAPTQNAEGRAVPYYWWGLGLAAVLIGLLLFDNREYLFHTPVLENTDYAANSLFVRETKDHVVLHGNYSRWRFYHPGPVLFYTYGLGEFVFHDLLHVVPTPFNGQVISLCVAVTLFFSLALTVFAQRLGAGRGGYRFFLPMALLVAVWHYGATTMAPTFVELWPPCTLILVFLCFVVATASVASGGGRELPLVAAAGGWLVHNHVAQPLFVVPMTLVSYVGLLAWCRRDASEDRRARGLRGAMGAGWHVFPRAHLIAGGVLALFLLPLLIDMLHGSDSNFSHILVHMRKQHAPMHGLLRSACYFLTFGSYVTYHPDEVFFGKFTLGGMRDFVVLHRWIYLGWGVALVATPLLLWAARRIRASVPAGITAEAAAPPPRRSTFLAWFGVMTALAVALTLFWGMKQDGEMWYYNAFFNYSIYYCAALGAVAALSALLQAVTASRSLRKMRPLLSGGLVLGFAAVAWSNASKFRVHLFLTPGERASAQIITDAAATLRPGEACFLDCAPWETWPVTISVALQLERLGHHVYVNENWETMFGERRIVSRASIDYSKPLACWSIVPTTGDPAEPVRWPLWGGCVMVAASLADLDPAGGSIVFAEGGNSARFARFGWAPTAGDWTWADQSEAMLQFRPLPLPQGNTGGVDMVIDAWSFTAAASPAAQRMETAFNGVSLPTVLLPVAAGTGEHAMVHFDADRWRDACERGFVEVTFRFPDAKTPYSLGLNDDVRRLGGGFRSIKFQVVP